MDGAAVQVGRNTTFMETINRAAIDYHISRPYRPEENPAKGGIRELKGRFYRLIVKHGVPERLWDFVLDYVVDTMNITANYSRYSDGRVSLEVITGITPNITEYMDFTIYGWVYYRTDGALGTNEIGDISWGKNEIPPQLMFDLELEDAEFKCSFNKLIEAEDVDDGMLQGTTETDDINAQNYVNMEIGLRRGQEGELQRAVVRRRIVDAEGNPTGVANNNQLLDTRQYKVEYEDGGTEIFSAKLLAENLLVQVDEHGHKHLLMEEITEHRSNKKAVKKQDGFYSLKSVTQRRRHTTAGWDFYVTWKDGSSNWIPL
ncbi:unnamed protein product [Cylindrotheca closterium]|uniref:Integrase catalytic domain-containing protein n=1 Tax=Cylindrotheca closterium TaxID=2856 RepID=A0AAD2CD50_9STRA|nr:unnamed protein product [Cylindrotheca closterium]